MPRAGLSAAVLVVEATALVDEQGYDALSLSGLADRVGVRPPSLYKHVGGLDDLRARLARHGFEVLGEVLRQAAAGREGREALAALAHAYRSFVRTQPGLYVATVRAPDADDPELAPAASVATEALFAVIAGYGIDDPAEQVHAARAVRSAVHGFVTLETAGGFGLPESVDESFDRLVDGLDAALARAAAMTG